jgi:hypothetical protein
MAFWIDVPVTWEEQSFQEYENDSDEKKCKCSSVEYVPVENQEERRKRRTCSPRGHLNNSNGTEFWATRKAGHEFLSASTRFDL